MEDKPQIPEEDLDIKTLGDNPKTAFIAGQLKSLQDKEDELQELLEQDGGMKDLVETEKKSLDKQREALLEQARAILAAEIEEEQTPDHIVIEVRAGAGGDEASLFARELADMYTTYCLNQGWKASKVDESTSDVGGYKEASFEVRSKEAYSDLEYETGVHRVQRIPATEKSDRIHTSTASVAVLPVFKRKQVDIDPSDVEMEFSRSGGKGGQNVNKVETAVRVIHKPTGLSVRCTQERSQQKNREKAMSILQAKLEERQREKEEQKYAEKRKRQIGTGDRSEKIRTYNFPQDRITDHRIKESWHNLENIMAGELGPIITALQKYAESEG